MNVFTFDSATWWTSYSLGRISKYFGFIWAFFSMIYWGWIRQQRGAQQVFCLVAAPLLITLGQTSNKKPEPSWVIISTVHTSLSDALGVSECFISSNENHSITQLYDIYNTDVCVCVSVYCNKILAYTQQLLKVISSIIEMLSSWAQRSANGRGKKP